MVSNLFKQFLTCKTGILLRAKRTNMIQSNRQIVQQLQIIFYNSVIYIQLCIQMKFSQLKQIGKLFQSSIINRAISQPQNQFHFTPSTFLSHPFLQSVYCIAQPKISINYERERVYFEDGGHVALDWSQRTSSIQNPPILFIMHGLTGGSEMNYIRVLTQEAVKEGYQCVCLNSRGINTEMTSPIPFTATSHTQLNAAIERVQTHFPKSPIYFVGTSFGGNYLIRYFLKNRPNNAKGLIALAPPFDVGKVVDDMGPIYQKFFVKRYINDTVDRHPEMKYWQNIGLVDLKEVRKSTNLRQFHSRITAKILGYESADYLFNQYSINGEMISQLKLNTLLMTSKDDPIVSYKAMPHDAITENKNIKFVATEKGGHLCWFEGIIPKRWYPKPVLNYIRSLREIS